MQHDEELHEKQLLNVVDDLSRFILHEVVNVRGKFFTKHKIWQRMTNTLGFVNGTTNSTVLPLVAVQGSISEKYLFNIHFNDVS